MGTARPTSQFSEVDAIRLIRTILPGLPEDSHQVRSSATSRVECSSARRTRLDLSMPTLALSAAHADWANAPSHWRAITSVAST